MYTVPEVQDVADFVGDSLGLSQQAAALDPSVRIIVFCGVHFMAETAAMLSPGRTVLLPDPTAGCPMADMVTDEDVRAMRREHPGAAVACYVNSTAAVKAESDVCVTSSNAVRVIARLAEREVIFVPDRSLGLWVQKQLPDKRLILWDGFCPIHHSMLRTQVESARACASRRARARPPREHRGAARAGGLHRQHGADRPARPGIEGDGVHHCHGERHPAPAAHAEPGQDLPPRGRSGPCART